MNIAADPLLVVENLRVEAPGRGGRTILDEITFEIRRGEILAVVGESGSGKSTLIRAIAGLMPVKKGSMRADGIDLASASHAAARAVRRRFQMVFQDAAAALDPRWRIARSIGEPLVALSPPIDASARRERIAAALEDVGLHRDHGERFPHELSGGQRQRAVIARALIARPELILLDEPVSALDVSIRAQVLALLVDLRSRYNLSYVFVSHDLAVTRQIADRVLVLERGRIVESGTNDEVLTAPRHPYTRALLAAVPSFARR